MFHCISSGSIIKNHITSCHGIIQGSSSVESLVTGFGGPHEFSSEWWAYITGPDCFYHSLFDVDGWELLTDKDKMWGFRVPDELTKGGLTPFFYAFLVESRVPADKGPALTVWGKLVEAGVSPKLAHILMYNLQYAGGTFTKGGEDWNSQHQVLGDNGHILWKSFLNNTVRQNLIRGQRTTLLWCPSNNFGTANRLSSKIDWVKYGTEGVSSSIRAYTKYSYSPEQAVELGKHVVKLINESYK